jgi:hypothetical protein
MSVISHASAVEEVRAAANCDAAHGPLAGFFEVRTLRMMRVAVYRGSSLTPSSPPSVIDDAKYLGYIDLTSPMTLDGNWALSGSPEFFRMAAVNVVPVSKPPGTKLPPAASTSAPQTSRLLVRLL